MKLTVAMFTLAVFLIVTSAFSHLGEEIDIKKKRLLDVKNLQSGQVRPAARKAKQKISELKFFFKKKGHAKKTEKKKNESNKKAAEVERQLLMAGYYITASQFSAIKLLISAFLVATAYFAGTALKLNSDMKLLCYAGALAAGLILPKKIIESKINKKKTDYINELPDLMDLLCVSVEAGLGFDAAIIRLYEKNRTPLMEEFMVAQRDIRHGISKKAAYTELSERCEIKELTAFLNAMLQAEDLGVSIKTVLKAQAELLRDDRKQKAEEKALKAPETMLMPMVIFIFPVIFIVLLGPAAMNLMEML